MDEQLGRLVAARGAAGNHCDQAAPARLLSVRFRPWGAYHFFDCPVSEIADQLVAAEDLGDRGEISELEEQLASHISKSADYLWVPVSASSNSGSYLLH